MVERARAHGSWRGRASWVSTSGCSRTWLGSWGCRHLLTTHPVAIQVQAYCAIIACLLIHLWTGGKPTLRTFEMICLYLQGWATLEELIAHVEKLKTKSRDPPTGS